MAPLGWPRQHLLAGGRVPIAYSPSGHGSALWPHAPQGPMPEAGSHMHGQHKDLTLSHGEENCSPEREI